MRAKVIDVMTGEEIERDLDAQEVAEIHAQSQTAPPTAEQQRRAILDSVGCVNETHLQKDILLAEGFGAMSGETPGPEGTLFQRNSTYRALLQARAALETLQ